MDPAYLERYRQRSAYESARTGPPAGFPPLPDLPLGRYTDPRLYELERDRLFGRTWLYAGHDSELPQVGSYKVCDIAGAPVVLVRGDDGLVRAFRNACRHRGAPVAAGPCGNTRLLVCRYHSWAYDLRGRLHRVPDERDFVGLCHDDRGLPPVRCEAWGGWHFVNLNHAAEPLLEWLAPMPTILADVAASPLQVIDSKSTDLRCNWKVVAEAFLEVYHARTIHPTTVGPALDAAGTVIELLDHGHQTMISPVRDRARTARRENLDTLAQLPPLMREPIQPAIGLFPNLISPLDGHGFPFLVFWPTAIDRTRLDITWFAPVRDDGGLPGVDVWEARLRRFDAVMEEDYANLEPIQWSIETAAHGGHVLNYQERRIWHVHAWIDKVVGPDLVPEALRIPDLLSDWVERAP